MRAARRFFVFGVLVLILAGVLVDQWFSGILLVSGLGALAGSLNVFLGGFSGR